MNVEAVSADIDGPRLAPASGGPARQLVVFIHGFGADGADLIDIGRQWAHALPDAAFVAPDGPERCPGTPRGRQWFPLARGDAHHVARGVRHAGPVLDRFIDHELARHRLGDADLALVGFSQGTMMALHVGLRRRARPAAIVGFSGALGAPESLISEISARPPVLLIHGDADTIVPVDALYLAIVTLARAKVPVEWHVRPGLGHGIDPVAMTIGSEVLADALGTVGR